MMLCKVDVGHISKAGTLLTYQTRVGVVILAASPACWELSSRSLCQCLELREHGEVLDTM